MVEYAFLDPGASVHMMEKDLHDEAQCDSVDDELVLRWTSGIIRREATKRTDLRISNISSKTGKGYSILRDVHAVDSMDLPTQTIDVDDLKKRYKYLRGLPLTSLKNVKPRIMIGLKNANCWLESSLSGAEMMNQWLPRHVLDGSSTARYQLRQEMQSNRVSSIFTM